MTWFKCSECGYTLKTTIHRMNVHPAGRSALLLTAPAIRLIAAGRET